MNNYSNVSNAKLESKEEQKSSKNELIAIKQEDPSVEDLDSVRIMFDVAEPKTIKKIKFAIDDNQQEIEVSVCCATAMNPGALQSGIFLWPGATYLSQYLCELYSKSGVFPFERVVELGAGAGLCGFVACYLMLLDNARSSINKPRFFLFTDRDFPCLKIIKQSVALNSFLENEHLTIKTKRLLFESAQKPGVDTFEDVDLIIGSDLIYSTPVAKALLLTFKFRFHVTKKTIHPPKLLLCSSFRDPITTAFIDKECAALNIQRTVIIDEINNGNCLLEEYSILLN